MSSRWDYREQIALARYVLRWTLLAAPTAMVVGSLCALFLWSLDRATQTFWAHPSLLLGLPLAGVAIAWVYRLCGKSVEAGTNLIVEQIHEPTAGVPARLVPLILISTVVTHLFGGSAGREGTAVQVGGSVASTLARLLRLPRVEVRKLLMVGVAAGFAGVFGTPLAGAVFAMEVLALGRMSYEAIFPVLVGAIVGDWACTAWGVHHTQYQITVGAAAFEWTVAGKVALAAIAFGLVSVLFSEAVHGVTHLVRRVPVLLRPVVGGTVVIGLVYLLGTRDYLGLGVEAPPGGHVSIVDSFSPGGADAYSWLLKILFTAITLGVGFKGGEVTPLFFIGATLGHTLALLTGAPIDLFAALGFVAVFAGATNTPLACTIMGIELFGASHVVYFAIACFVAYLFSGHNGIYLSQRIGTSKPSRSHVELHAESFTADTTLKSIRERSMARDV
jgi:H+/Cl- antiporter ClcA